MAKSKTTKKQSEIKVEHLRSRVKAVSVDKMVDENLNAVHTSDYQTYLRKLMRESAGKF